MGSHNLNLLYDLDSGEVKTDRQPDPFNAAILKHLTSHEKTNQEREMAAMTERPV